MALLLAVLPAQQIAYGRMEKAYYCQLLAFGVFLSYWHLYEEMAWVGCLAAVLIALSSFSVVRRFFMRKRDEQDLWLRHYLEKSEQSTALTEELGFGWLRFSSRMVGRFWMGAGLRIKNMCCMLRGATAWW